MKIWHASQNSNGRSVQKACGRVFTALLIAAFVQVTVISTGWAESAGENTSERTEGPGTQYGLGTASVFLSIPYGLGKFLFATLGGLFGGFTYVFSGANERAAKSVWDTSMRGTYVITPDHLKGEKTIRFLGTPAEGSTENVPQEPTPLEPAPEPIK